MKYKDRILKVKKRAKKKINKQKLLKKKLEGIKYNYLMDLAVSNLVNKMGG